MSTSPPTQAPFEGYQLLWLPSELRAQVLESLENRPPPSLGPAGGGASVAPPPGQQQPGKDGG